MNKPTPRVPYGLAKQTVANADPTKTSLVALAASTGLKTNSLRKLAKQMGIVFNPARKFKTPPPA